MSQSRIKEGRTEARTTVNAEAFKQIKLLTIKLDLKKYGKLVDLSFDLLLEKTEEEIAQLLEGNQNKEKRTTFHTTVNEKSYNQIKSIADHLDQNYGKLIDIAFQLLLEKSDEEIIKLLEEKGIK